MCTQRRLRSTWPVCSEYWLCTQWVAKDPSFLHADSEDSDQTGRMPRLIWVFAGRTCHFVGFVMRRFILYEPNYENVCQPIPVKQILSSYLFSLQSDQCVYNWAMYWENQFYAICDQPAHPRTQISIFVVLCLDSILPLLAISKISRLKLAIQSFRWDFKPRSRLHDPVVSGTIN